MKKEGIGYKVVRLSGSGDRVRLLSAATYDLGWVVVYSQGFASYGRGGTPLFAFDTLPHARYFCQFHLGSRQVWKACLRRPKLRKRLATGVLNFARYWAGKRRGVTADTPVGTVACEAITLLEKAD